MIAADRQDLSVKAEPGGVQCTEVAVGSAPGKAGAAAECVQVTDGPAGRRSVSEAVSSTQDGAGTCSIGSAGYWSYERFGSCLKDMTTTYTLRDDKGTAIGSAQLKINLSMSLSATSSMWTELVTVTMVSSTSNVPSLNIAFDASCTAPCQMGAAKPWAGARTLTPGTSAQGTVLYSDSPAVGAVDSLANDYHMYVTQDNTIPLQPNVNWTNPRKVRCDNAVHEPGKGSPGCVYADVRPDLSYSLTDYGAAAATYAFALNYLPNMPKQFTRLKGDSEPNRKRTCGAQSTVPFAQLDPVAFPEDSCDEFPFAGTYQGGTNGGLCAEIVPQLTNGNWTFRETTGHPVTYKESCVRGHVPLPVNKAAAWEVRQLRPDAAPDRHRGVHRLLDDLTSTGPGPNDTVAAPGGLSPGRGRGAPTTNGPAERGSRR